MAVIQAGNGLGTGLVVAPDEFGFAMPLFSPELSLSQTDRTSLGDDMFLYTFDVIGSGSISSAEVVMHEVDDPFSAATFIDADYKDSLGASVLTIEGAGIGVACPVGEDPPPCDLSEAPQTLAGAGLVDLSGNDTIIGAGFGDEIHGFDGNDELHGKSGDDRLFGDGGSDTLRGGGGEDVLIGGARNDALFGGGGNDTLKGKNGRDSLKGGDGDDTLLGGAKDDRLDGGDGDDKLKGEDGDDVFVFSLGNDKAKDFDPTGSADVIDLSGFGQVFTSFVDLENNHMEQVGDHVIIDDLAGNTLKLVNVALSDLTEADFVFAV